MKKTSIIAVAFAATLGLAACGGETATEETVNDAAADLNATVDAAEADLNAPLDTAADAPVAAEAAANEADAAADNAMYLRFRRTRRRSPVHGRCRGPGVRP